MICLILSACLLLIAQVPVDSMTNELGIAIALFMLCDIELFKLLFKK